MTDSSASSSLQHTGSALTHLYSWLAGKFPQVRSTLWALAYDLIARFNHSGEWTLMNYGYLEEGERAPEARTMQETERFCRGLYAKTIGYSSLAGLDVLEVGCGVGGGARHLTETYEPRSYLGLDFCPRAVHLATRAHAGVKGLRFVQGNAEALPCEPESFDVIVNVESSHCYPSTPKFFEQVARALRPGGRLYWSDLRHGESYREIDPALAAAGLKAVESADITEGVLRSMNAISQARSELISRKLPAWLAGMGRDFAGTPGSLVHNKLSTQRARYMWRVAERPLG